MRFALALILAATLAAPAAWADDWGTVATISGTMGVQADRLCLGEASRHDIGCPDYAPIANTMGLTVSGTVSATRFVGDGSGLTGVSSADRIVSGTSNAVIGPDGTVTMRGRLDLVTGTAVVAVGQGAAQSNTMGYVTALGSFAGYNNTGGYITAVGDHAGYNNTGSQVTTLGNAAGQNNIGIQVTALGAYAGYNNAGFNTTAVGYQAAISNTNANVTAVGSLAGNNNLYGNVTLLGYNAQADKANQVVLGNGSVVEVSTSGVYVGAGISVTNAVSATDGVFTGKVGVGMGLYPLAQMAIKRQNDGTVLGSDFGLYLQQNHNVSSTGSYYGQASSFNLTPVIASGATNTGYAMGSSVAILRQALTADAGTLATLYGQRIAYGHYQSDPGATRSTSNTYGLILNPYVQNGTMDTLYDLYISTPATGGTINKHYAIYQADTTASSYFAGRVGIGRNSPTTALEVGGTVSATRFVGDGSGLTGIASSGDRIVSGTSSVVVNNGVGAVVSGTLQISGQVADSCGPGKYGTMKIVDGRIWMCRQD